jgi:hypothetical protein
MQKMENCLCKAQQNKFITKKIELILVLSLRSELVRQSGILKMH